MIVVFLLFFITEELSHHQNQPEYSSNQHLKRHSTTPTDRFQLQHRELLGQIILFTKTTLMIHTEMVSKILHLLRCDIGNKRLNLNAIITVILFAFIDLRSQTPKIIQTTYRPSKIAEQPQTTPTKIKANQRDPYTNLKQNQLYDNPTQVYNTEYDDPLVSQVFEYCFVTFLSISSRVV